MGISEGFLKRNGKRCYFCNRAVRRPPEMGGALQADMATVDHLTPVSRGGQTRRDSGNCVLACYGCNQAKENRTLQELIKDGWRYGLPVQRKKTMAMAFNSKARRLSDRKIETRSFYRHYSMLMAVLNNHVDILV